MFSLQVELFLKLHDFILKNIATLIMKVSLASWQRQQQTKDASQRTLSTATTQNQREKSN